MREDGAVGRRAVSAARARRRSETTPVLVRALQINRREIEDRAAPRRRRTRRRPSRTRRREYRSRSRDSSLRTSDSTRRGNPSPEKPDVDRFIASRGEKKREDLLVQEDLAAGVRHAPGRGDRHAPGPLARETPVGSGLDGLGEAVPSPFGDPRDAINRLLRGGAEGIDL